MRVIRQGDLTDLDSGLLLGFGFLLGQLDRAGGS